jgi:hypothetical protein
VCGDSGACGRCNKASQHYRNACMRLDVHMSRSRRMPPHVVRESGVEHPLRTPSVPFRTRSVPLSYPFSTPCVPLQLQYPFRTPSVPFRTPSVPFAYPFSFSTPFVPLQYPFVPLQYPFVPLQYPLRTPSASVPLQYPFSTPSVTPPGNSLSRWARVASRRRLALGLGTARLQKRSNIENRAHQRPLPIFPRSPAHKHARTVARTHASTVARTHASMHAAPATGCDVMHPDASLYILNPCIYIHIYLCYISSRVIRVITSSAQSF